ncbi:MAG: PAS domain S-box protein [Kiritimatiellae bacterium]|nr:PAS domain S-box protein [Kiritimatiellia bacterium]
MQDQKTDETSRYTQTLLIGLGTGGAALLPYLVANPEFKLVGVCDSSAEAIGAPMARMSGIPFFDDPVEAIEQLKPQLVVDATGDPSLPTTLHRVRPAGTSLVTADASRLLWELLAAMEGRRRSDLRYDRLLNDLNSGIVVVQNGTIRYTNPAFLLIANTTSEETLGRAYTDFVAPELRERSETYLSRELSGEDAVGEYDTQILTPDGHLREVHVRMRVSDWNGRPAVLMILSDVTKLKELERERERFFRFMVHELRAPLSPLVTALPLLRRQEIVEQPEKFQSILAMMERSVDRLTSFIDDFLDLSKLDKQALKMRREPVNLKTILNEVAENQRILAEDKGLSFHVEEWPDFEIYGDPTVIRTLCQNLMNNAIKYTEKGGVTVRVKPERDTFSLEVEDTGSGLTEEEQAGLFQEYGRIQRTKGVKGTGLGLALVKKLVTACNGDVTVQSSGKGQGSTFAFSLPRVFGNEANAPNG